MAEFNKRRRTSSDTYVAVVDQENVQTDNDRPTTPKRTSYQSPTKASLARSNPTALQLIDQAKARRESEPNRRQSLRDAVLGNKNNHQAQGTPTQQVQSVDSDKTASQRRADTEKWIEDSFKDIDPAPLIPTPKRPYYPPIPSSAIVPKLVKNHTSASFERARRSTSIELPPTPVQQGREAPPERPRGLLTSSPGGSGRRRQRVRHGNIHSSPLKPRDLPPITQEEDEDLEVASGIGDEPEDLPERSGGTPDLELVEAIVRDTVEDIDESNIENEDQDNPFNEEFQPDLPAETLPEQVEDDDPKVQEKFRKLKAFQAQLKALKNKCSDLEALNVKFNDNLINNDPVERLKAAELLLASYEDPPKRQVPQPEDKRIFKQNAGKYLTSFAPYGFRMSYETWEQCVKGSQKFVYQTTFGAPACWPPLTLATTFNVIVDLESEKVEAVKYVADTSMPRSLATWIKEKTTDPLSCTDLATISTGVSAYFHEATRRAKVFKHLDDARNHQEKLETKSALITPVTSQAEAASLCQYISESTFISQLGEVSAARTRRSLGSAKQIMLVYDIQLDWVGNASAVIEIAGSNLSEPIMENAKKLFKEKLEVDGVIAAFSAVKSILGSEEQNKKKGAAKNGTGKKARRMTEADFM